MSVGAARRLETGMSVGQAGGYFGAVGRAKSLIWTPASSCKALRHQHVKAVLGRVQMFFASDRQVSLHRRGERIYMAIGMSSRKRVFACRERVKKTVVQVANSELLVSIAGSALVRDEQIF